LLAAESGSGAVIVLHGGSGIGKTRIAEVIGLEASERFVHAWGYCRERDQTPPLWPIIGPLRGVYERLAPTLREDSRFQALVPELAVILPELAASPAPSAGVQTKGAARSSRLRSIACSTRSRARSRSPPSTAIRTM
jgi:hypothetical protein